MTTRTAQALRKMARGTLSGQSAAATPVAAARAQRRHRPAIRSCLELRYTLNNTNPDTDPPVPGTTEYYLSTNFASDLSHDNTTLYVVALDEVTPFSDDNLLATVDFPSMTTIGIHPGPIVVNRANAFAVGPDGAIYNLRLDSSFSPANSTHLEKTTSAGVPVYSVPTTGETFAATGLVYNPVHDLLFGYVGPLSGVDLQQWDPTTGAMTTLPMPGGALIDPNTTPVVTADGTVWVIQLGDTHIGRWNPSTASWTVYALPFRAAQAIWCGPHATSVTVFRLDPFPSAWFNVDYSGSVSLQCTIPPPGGLLSSTLVADDASVVLIQAANNFYAWG